jgi:hypothetical protein
MIIMTTYYGTAQEYQRLLIAERLSRSITLRVLTFSGFSGQVLHLVEKVVVALMGRTVSPHLDSWHVTYC